ncbi:hypothetical protein VSP9026_00493 [Vibrio spartinae]|uniref:Uncharacterized protein n=1 Tax=Vibrio spartinae TaxID=1918945 RepID=A0A1N6M093_9VIBR|nr:hypothetical protein VSP9026_00493 [Vibrio spartinae]
MQCGEFLFIFKQVFHMKNSLGSDVILSVDSDMEPNLFLLDITKNIN